MQIEADECNVKSLLEPDCVSRIHNGLTFKMDELAGPSKIS